MLLGAVTIVGLAVLLSLLIAWFVTPLDATARSETVSERDFVAAVDLAPKERPGARGVVSDRLLAMLSRGSLNMAAVERQASEPPPTHPVAIDYILQHPSYRFGLTPFRISLALGQVDKIVAALGRKVWLAAEQRGQLSFQALEEEPLLTIEVLIPPDAAKVEERTKKQTKRVEHAKVTRFDFLVIPAVAEDLPVGIRMTYQVPVLKETRSLEEVVVTGSTDPEKCRELEGVRCEQTIEKRSIQWEPVDVELLTLWVTVSVRSLFGMSSGTATAVKLLLTPLATLAVLWLILRQGQRPDTAYLVTMAVLNILGVTLPQELTNALKPKVQKPTQSGPFA